MSSIAPLPYLKIILHASKYPSSSILGLLLGTQDPTTHFVQVVDVIPMLHSWTDLSVAMEIGLQLADIHAQNKKLQLVGIYVANARIEDKSIPFTAGKVADLLKREVEGCLVLVVDNEKLNSNESALIPHTSPTPSTWVPSTITLLDPTIPHQAIQQARAGKHSSLRDFDDYLTNVDADWLENKSITV